MLKIITLTLLLWLSINCVWLFAIPWTAARQAFLSFTISQSLFKLMSIESVMPFKYPSLSPPFFTCQKSFPASGSFPMSQLFTSGGQSIGASGSASILPMNIQDWFPLGLTGLISLLSKGLSRGFSNARGKSVNSSAFSFLYCPTLTSIHEYCRNNLTIWTFVGKVMSLHFNILSRLVIAFLPRSKYLLISWLQLISAVISEPKKIKFVTVSIFSSSICHEVKGPDAMIFVFWMLNFSFTLFFHFHQEAL